MGRIYDGIDERLAGWIARQPLFFVGTAPSGADGHVNVSPKGPIGSLRVLDDHTIAYLDIVGSGAETIAHLRDNGRIVVMLCAFEGPPRIVRLHGRGEVVYPSDERFAALLDGFQRPAHPEAERAIVLVDVTRVALDDDVVVAERLPLLEAQRGQGAGSSTAGSPSMLVALRSRW